MAGQPHDELGRKNESIYRDPTTRVQKGIDTGDRTPGKTSRPMCVPSSIRRRQKCVENSKSYSYKFTEFIRWDNPTKAPSIRGKCAL